MLFRASADSLAESIRANTLYTHMEDRFLHTHRYRPGPSERRSWENSIPPLVNVLREAGLGEVEVILEYTLPLTSQRVDALLAGVHPETGEPSYVVVELKQWTEAWPAEGSDRLCVVPDAPGPPRLNPIEQVRGYCRYLVQFNAALDGNEHRAVGVAYLHNATQFGASGLDVVGQSTQGRLFTEDRRGAFLTYLRQHLAPLQGADAADQLLNAGTKPSKKLVAVAAREVRERQTFTLLAEQQVAFELVLSAVRAARRSNRKRVIVISGGPGSGKSVIALSLLGELYRQGRTALHATGSASFTKTMRKVAGARKPEVQSLFKYFNSFMTAEPNDLDVLICDEAHRMRETSANRWTKAADRIDKPQVEELMDAARVPVFLLDAHQVVRPGEMGSQESILQVAEKRGLDTDVVHLDGQFRCGGSDAYLKWVVRLLGLETDETPVRWEPDKKMRLAVAESPQEMEDFLLARQDEGFAARMSAGYCWKWTTKVAPGEPLPADVSIGDWSRPWNVYGERAVAGAPPAALWATDPAGFGQVGCVYTAQGFEYDWSGVILGPDLVWRTDHWVVVRTASKDPVFRKSTPETAVNRLIRNTYKVLLTRGMIGTVIYSTDHETRAYLRHLVGAGLDLESSKR